MGLWIKIEHKNLKTLYVISGRYRRRRHIKKEEETVKVKMREDPEYIKKKVMYHKYFFTKVEKLKN